jgi:VCBS repeat-containing protein
VRASIKPLGIGDLKVVKQTLRNYAPGEVAHIENVLRGEYKERKHRELDRTEQTVTTETETEQETTKDTQTTERFELKKESENTIQEQMSVQAGVTVTASYGPVTLGAHGDFAYSTSSSQSEKTASNYAREVVDRSVTRIQTKTREERVTKTLHEVEEIDTHGIDNKTKPDHMIGVYRWVDKYYEAQIYNYGKRMMFEFVVPEPAAFYGYAQTHKLATGVTAQAPKPLGTLTHKDLNMGNYHKYIRDYGVQGCTPPPPEYKVVSATMSSDAQLANGTSLAKSSKDLVVPDGYKLDELAYSMSFVYQNYPQWHLSIGTDDLVVTYTNNTATRRFDAEAGPGGDYDGIIPVSLDSYDVNAYFVNVAAYCKRTPEKYELWQIQTYEKIVAAYQALKAAYDQKVAAQASQDIGMVHGQNPGINREIEKNELKKQ